MKLSIVIEIEIFEHFFRWVLALFKRKQPSPPTNLIATLGENMNVTLTWTPPVLKPGQSAVKSYRVYAKAEGAPDFGLINEVTDPTLVDENVAAGKWSYGVTTVDVKNRESVMSTTVDVVVDVQPDSVPPSPPTNLQAVVA